MKKQKIAIIGAGSTYTPELIEGLIKRQTVMPVKELALMDIDAEKLGIVGGLCGRMISHCGMDCKVTLTDSLDEALLDAMFVFVQIRVGKLPARVLDEKIPLKYDLIGQETTGIGGFLKALRTIPVLLEIGKKMERLCPEAFMINFSNPSGICTQAMALHSKTKMLGLCNVPIGMLTDPLEALQIDSAKFDYLGLNHLSFVTGIRNGGRDYLREAVSGNETLLDMLDGQQGFDKEILRMIGAIPCGYVDYYLNPRQALEKEKAEQKTRGEVCMEIEAELLQLYQQEGLYVKPEQLSKRGGAMYSEVAVSLAESIYLDDGKVHVVNTLNRGAIPFMDNEDVVETRAVITSEGATPLHVDTDSRYIKGLMRTVKVYEHYTVEAAVSGSHRAAIQALLANPLIGDYTAATNCFHDMLRAHKRYLPQFQ